MSKNACSLGLERLKQNNPDGFFAIVMKKGCPPCKPMRKLVKKTVGKRLTVVEIPADDLRCDPIIDKLRITESPSVLFFKGKTVKRISEGDKTDDDIRAQIAVIVGKKPQKR